MFLSTAQYLLSIGACPVLLNGKVPIFANYSGYVLGTAGASDLTLQPDKRPLYYTTALLEAWAREYPNANTGMLTRDFPTIDIDEPALWSVIYDLLPFTPTAKRGARGFSLIYRNDPRDPVRRTRTFTNRFSKTMLLEVLADGRQTVLPPSIHPETGLRYEWRAMTEWGHMLPVPLGTAPLGVLSQATVDAIEARLVSLGYLKARVERGATRAERVLPEERRRYEAYVAPKIAERMEAVRGAQAGGRQAALNGAVYALAPWVREGFIDEQQFEDDLREACVVNGYIREDGDRAFQRQYEKALDEGWNTDLPDLDAGRAAALMGPAPTGSLALAAPQPTVSGPVANVPPTFWTYDGTLPAEEPELIRRILPAASGTLAFIAGKSGMGKSFFLTAMAVALAMGQGTQFFGQPVRERVGTIIIAAEGAGGMRARLYAAAKRLGAVGNLPIVVVPRCGNLALDADRAAMVSTLRQAAEHLRAVYNVRVGVVAVDTMLAAFGMEDEGASAEAQRICGHMRELGACVGAVAVPVHHVGKDESQGMRGSSAFHAAADHVIICGGDQDALTGETTGRYLAVTKSRNDSTGPISNAELQVVELGINQYGETRFTCFYAWAPGKVEPKKDKKHGVHASVFDKAYDIVLARDGGEGVPDTVLRMQFYLLSHAGSNDTKKKAYQRVRDKMIVDGLYRSFNDVWFRETICRDIS